MGLDPKGMDRLNQVALVIYIPGILAEFLDAARLELSPGCRPRAHVTVLPPRPLAVPWQAAAEGLLVLAGEFAPFEIEAAGLAAFPATDVIYLEIARGNQELRRLHDAAGGGCLVFDEPFPFHPHITVSQELPPGTLARARELATRRWLEYTGPRSFRAEKAMFVRNGNSDGWIDLAEFSFGAVPPNGALPRQPAGQL